MKFVLEAEQAEFGRVLGRMLAAADTPGAVRAWAAGDSEPGRRVWRRLAEAGVFALAVPEEYQGVGLRPVELAVAYEELGWHAVPGPVVECAASAVLLARLGDAARGQDSGTGPVPRPEAGSGPGARWLPRIATAEAIVSYADRARGPYALDADTADVTFVRDGDTLWTSTASGPVQPSLDPARRLARPHTDGAGAAAAAAAAAREAVTAGAYVASGPAVVRAAAHAADTAAFLTAAQALGAGRRLLAETVTYVKRRTQFGVPIGSFQAVRHRLADVLLALEFARPLVYGAAVALAGDEAGAGREIAAAKVAAGEAAYGAARAALQLHGAIGYTQELDLSLWLLKARALRTAWGTPSECRARVLGTPAAL
ncbi:acyl-CoA dehydrogenase family protein [Streptomyces sp. MST-110588]|uniref:acyl-CoA dehydrogenase family protein n=1 Tax=Streptomyces sp. MST-110588 TaxID=2833628 RepID=UPI001F5CBF3F|nr:acyl-CoA dehydrogenase family protein [Streptomyces sp. MST-110588]UNO43049.1 acyl-CoA dehydrogenase family protein [Streptomyces sp. MST-110588]